MKFFNDQQLIVTKNGQTFSGRYSNNNKLNEEVVIGKDFWIRLSEADSIEIKQEELDDNTKNIISQFVSSMTNKPIEDNDKEAIYDALGEICGASDDSTKEKIKRQFNKERAKSELVKFGESLDDEYHAEYDDDYSTEDNSSMYDYNLSNEEVINKMYELYQTNTRKEDLVDYYSFLTGTDAISSSAFVDEFIKTAEGDALNIAANPYDENVLDTEIENFLVDNDSEEKSLEDIFYECCEHFNVSVDAVMRENKKVSGESFEALKEAIYLNRLKNFKCTPKRFVEALSNVLQEEQFKDTFMPEDALNTTLGEFVSPVSSTVELETNDSEPVTDEDSYQQWQDEFEREVGSKIKMDPEDFAMIVKYLAKYVEPTTDFTNEYDLGNEEVSYEGTTSFEDYEETEDNFYSTEPTEEEFEQDFEQDFETDNEDFDQSIDPSQEEDYTDEEDEIQY